MASCGTFQKLRPLSLLEHLAGCYDSAQLKVFSGSVSWSLYLEQGKLTYASHSVDPFDRLDCHLRRLSHQIPTLSSETRAQLRLLFESESESQSIPNRDYQAICWLVEHQYLNSVQTAVLIDSLVKEVIESFLLVREGNYELAENTDILTEFCRLDLRPLVEHCQRRLKIWQSLGPQIWSPYQRPYFLNKNTTHRQVLPETQQKLSAMLKGFSFRHLAILINQDELQLAQSLHPYIVNGTVVLNEPHPPFNQLPPTFNELLRKDLYSPESLTREKAKIPPNNSVNSVTKSTPNHNLNQFSSPASENTSLYPQPRELEVGEASLPVRQKREITPPPVQIEPQIPPKVEQRSSTFGGLPISPEGKKTYKIVCVDDSPTMLQEISYFLDDESFAVFPVSDSVKALMQIIRVKPDLILLDIRMSGIDGYELCRLLRNHSLFKNTPIIMVTGNTGIIDRVKARLVGASGYLTKPFTQSELLKMIFRHLS